MRNHFSKACQWTFVEAIHLLNNCCDELWFCYDCMLSPFQDCINNQNDVWWAMNLIVSELHQLSNASFLFIFSRRIPYVHLHFPPCTSYNLWGALSTQQPCRNHLDWRGFCAAVPTCWPWMVGLGMSNGGMHPRCEEKLMKGGTFWGDSLFQKCTIFFWEIWSSVVYMFVFLVVVKTGSLFESSIQQADSNNFYTIFRIFMVCVCVS